MGKKKDVYLWRLMGCFITYDCIKPYYMFADPQQIVNEITFSTAEEFLDFLSPTRDSLGRGDWVFRGHANAAWTALPSLYRSPKETIVLRLFDSFKRLIQPGDLWQVWSSNLQNSDRHFETQITSYVENRLLSEFANNSNKIGLPVPEIEKLLNRPKERFPQVPMYPSLDQRYENPVRYHFQEYVKSEQSWPGIYAGLAQHHGIPTRLLDFSYSSLNAVHFAVKPADENDVCIWAVNTKYFEHGQFWWMESEQFDLHAQMMIAQHSLMRMPNSTNSYLHRQQGLFIFAVFPYDFYFIHSRYPTFVDHLNLIGNNIFATYPKPFGEYAYKLVLPAEHYHELKARIKALGITLSSLMPTYDNVATEIKEGTVFSWDIH